MICTCTNEQLHWVGCECEAECNTGTAELDRRFDAEQARTEAAFVEGLAEMRRREIAAEAAEAAYWEAQLKAQERADNFDWDGYNNRCIERFGLFPA